MGFCVGQKVVCVASDPNNLGPERREFLWLFPDGQPEHGSIQEVKAVGWPGFVAVRGFRVILRATGTEYGFHPDCFRPLLDADLEEQVNELEEQTVKA